MTIESERALFNDQTAPRLAASVGVTQPWEQGGSARFAYFCDDQRFAVVAGSQEGGHVDLAFALGVSYRGDRQLVLVLPEQHVFATLQRAPWFAGAARPHVYVHDGVTPRPWQLPDQDETVAWVATAKRNLSPEEELRRAATPKHLGSGSEAVYELVEWATRDEPLLDASHRRGERSWHCMGQKVLSIKATKTGLAITAGIHYSKPGEAPQPQTLVKGEALTPGQLASVKARVLEAMTARLSGPPPIHRPDEHWLQAVIRRDPSLGVEQPALRELPAWRPGGNGVAKSWRRGYIDLLGIDGHGDIRIVETKLADNTDDLLVFQGLDYYIWACAYRRVLLDRLGAPDGATFEIHYVIGDTSDGEIRTSKHIGAHVRGLDPKIRWRFQTIHNWYGNPSEPRRARSKLLDTGQVRP